jgi:DNA-binding response OmpR family regulator
MSSDRHILLVEDDPTVREMIKRALQRSYVIHEATDGMHASELLTQIPALPALVICDVMMPRVDGFSLARLMKNDEKLKGVPILFLTARTAAQDVVQGIQLGARHYMTKPFKVSELVDRVESLVTGRQSRH